MAVFIGVGLVWKEVEQRSVYSLLSKPVRRQELVLGKYVGLALTLGVNVAMMTTSGSSRRTWPRVASVFSRVSTPSLRV